MPEIDADLLAGLKRAKTDTVHFAVVAKGSSDGALLVSKKAIMPAEIAAAKKKSGGTSITQGTAHTEDGKMIFETDGEPPATLEKLIKLLAKRDAGLVLQLETRAAPVQGDNAPQQGNAAPQQNNATQQQGNGTPQQGSTQQQTKTNGAERVRAARTAYEQAMAQATAGVDKLESALRATDDESASEIADIVDQLAEHFPTEVGDALEQLEAGENANSPSVPQLKTAAQNAIKHCMEYMNGHAEVIDACEQNPFGVAVSIKAPLTESLKTVLASLK